MRALLNGCLRVERALERALSRVAARTRFLAGSAVLLLVAWAAMGGNLWSFERLPASRYSSMAILTGTWRLRSALSTVAPDEQVFGGAGYTNWGFGVPLLQAPFHALARATGMATRFFPDRAIYFFYCAPMIPLLWAAFERLLTRVGDADLTPVRRQLLSWGATLWTLSFTLFPLMSDRFLVYEETISYMLVFELLAIAAYVFATPELRCRRVVPIAIAAGVGLLIRPTGLVLLGAWWAIVALESRRWRSIAAFTVAAAPFVALWLWTNRIRSGSPFALGLSNALPHFGQHVLAQRFGASCVDTPWHFVQVVGRLFDGLFFVTSDPTSPWMRQCHMEFERRPADGWIYPDEGILGVPVLALLVAVAVHALRDRGARRLSRLVPFCAFAALFFSYARAGVGPAWRYAGDFWPLVVMAAVQAIGTPGRWTARLLALPAGVAVLAVALFTFLRHVPSSVGGVEIVHVADAGGMWDDFARSRWTVDPPRPSRIACGDPLDGPYENGFGWTPFCEVGEVTQVYLGVPDGPGDDLELRFDAPGATAETLRVYVNGRVYEARRAGELYSTRVHVARKDLFSPVVLVAIEWTRGFVTPWSVALRSIELT